MHVRYKHNVYVDVYSLLCVMDMLFMITVLMDYRNIIKHYRAVRHSLPVSLLCTIMI